MDKVGDAERACEDLRDALRAAGVTLPSLGLDAVSCAGSAPLALVDLGRCNVATARALASALVEPAPEPAGRARVDGRTA